MTKIGALNRFKFEECLFSSIDMRQIITTIEINENFLNSILERMKLDPDYSCFLERLTPRLIKIISDNRIEGFSNTLRDKEAQLLGSIIEPVLSENSKKCIIAYDEKLQIERELVGIPKKNRKYNSYESIVNTASTWITVCNGALTQNEFDSTGLRNNHDFLVATNFMIAHYPDFYEDTALLEFIKEMIEQTKKNDFEDKKSFKKYQNIGDYTLYNIYHFDNKPFCKTKVKHR